jgi:hypothetical protein
MSVKAQELSATQRSRVVGKKLSGNRNQTRRTGGIAKVCRL